MAVNLGEYIDNLDQKILQKILETRKSNKISRRQIAEDLGFTLSTYRDMESGRTAFPLPRLIAVMKYLDLPLSLDVQSEQGIDQETNDIQALKRENAEIKALLHKILRKLDEKS